MGTFSWPWTFLAVVAPAIDATCVNVEIPLPGRRTILRCIIKRVQENLGMILATTESDHPHMSTIMLRPLCEDLIYGAWLGTLPENAADKLVLLSTSADITKSILAQTRFLPKAYASLGPLSDGTFGLTLSSIMLARGFGFDSSNAQARYDLLMDELKQLGLELGWPGGRIPSIYKMANQAGLGDIYDFFYHGSSKAVHANLHNMSRMVWGDPERHIFTIDSYHFEDYYISFALVHGIWLASETIDRIAKPEFPDEFQLMDEQSYSVWLALVLAGLARRGAFLRW